MAAQDGKQRVYLSSPHLEELYVAEVLATNWIAPLDLDAFEREFCAVVSAFHAAAHSSGTVALHLALNAVRVGPSNEVLVSTLTFSASVNPILDNA